MGERETSGEGFAHMCREASRRSQRSGWPVREVRCVNLGSEDKCQTEGQMRGSSCVGIGWGTWCSTVCCWDALLRGHPVLAVTIPCLPLCSDHDVSPLD